MLPIATNNINSNQRDINISDNVNNLNDIMSNNLLLSSELYISPMFGPSLYSSSQNQIPIITQTPTIYISPINNNDLLQSATSIKSTFTPIVKLGK